MSHCDFKQLNEIENQRKKDFETSKDIILRIKKSFGYVFAIKETVFFIWWFEGAIK